MPFVALLFSLKISWGQRARPSAKVVWSRRIRSVWRSVMSHSDRPSAHGSSFLGQTSFHFIQDCGFFSVLPSAAGGEWERLWVASCYRQDRLMEVWYAVAYVTGSLFLHSLLHSFSQGRREFGVWLYIFLKRRSSASRQSFVSVGFYYWKN